MSMGDSFGKQGMINAQLASIMLKNLQESSSKRAAR